MVHEHTGEVLYRNACMTNQPISGAVVETLGPIGRVPWKVENESTIRSSKIGAITPAPPSGAGFEHNFGHGQQ
jgi:hypothetical protein